MVMHESCKYGDPCSIHENPCAHKKGGIARCFECGEEIYDQFRCLGSQANITHPEWIWVCCAACMKVHKESMAIYDRRCKERLADFPNTSLSTWNGMGI